MSAQNLIHLAENVAWVSNIKSLERHEVFAGWKNSRKLRDDFVDHCLCSFEIMHEEDMDRRVREVVRKNLDGPIYSNGS